MNESKFVRSVTATFLVGCTAFLVVWDALVANNEVKNDTISEIVRDVSWDVWLLPFVVMGVCGHLFWNRAGSTKPFRPRLLVGACAIVGARDVLWWAAGWPPIPNANLVVGLVGLILGALWWPQLRPEGQRGEQAEPGVD